MASSETFWTKIRIRDLIVLFLCLNVFSSWFLHNYIAEGVSYVANDAWQFIDDPFMKTRGVSRYLTIPVYPFLHNLSPTIGVLLDSFSFSLVLVPFFLSSNLRKKSLLLVLVCGLTLPFWVVVTQWYRWPGQMFSMNILTAFFFWFVLIRSDKIRYQILAAGLYIFAALAYYEIYCLFALMVPFFKSFSVKEYLRYVTFCIVFIGLAFVGSKLYQMYFFNISEISVGYRQLVASENDSILLKYSKQFFEALIGTTKAWFINLKLGTVGLTIFFLVVFLFARDSKKYLHAIVVVSIFIGMFAVTNHSVMQRSAAPLYYMPFALILSRERHNFLGLFGLVSICLLYLYSSLTVSLPVHKFRAARILSMVDEIKSNVPELLIEGEKGLIVIGSGKSKGWSFYDLNAASFTLQKKGNAGVAWCGEQYVWGPCGKQVKHDEGFKNWLCNSPASWESYEGSEFIFISVGDHKKLECS